MAFIDSKIKRWAEQGLITPEQGLALSAFERAHAPWSEGLVIILGVSALSLGIIAIIASNWEYVPGWLKLGGNGLLLCLSAYLPWRFQEKALAFELLTIFYMLFCLAGIGLVAQVFHSIHPLYMASGLWCLMTAGLFWLAENRFTAFIWLLGLGWSGLLLYYERSVWEDVLLPIHLLLGYALLALIFAFLQKPRQRQAAAVIFTLLLLTVTLSSEFLSVERQIEFYALAQAPWLSWTLLALIGLGILGITRTGFYSRGRKIALLLGWIWLLGFFNMAPQRLSSYLLGEMHYREGLLNPAATFSLLAWLAFYALVNGRRRLLLLWLLLAGGRIAVIFLTAFYGLWETGLGLFVAGAVLIVIPLCWKKVLLPKLFPPARASAAAAKAPPPGLPLRRRKLALAAALLAPLLLWAALVSYKTFNLYFAQHRLILAVHGYDPRDLLSGHYLQYRVDYGGGEEGGCGLASSPEAETASYLYMHNPGTPEARLDQRPPADPEAVYIKGVCRRGLFQAGIERFYVPEDKAPLLDRILRAAEIPAGVEVRISAGGQAQVREFLLDGQPWPRVLKQLDGQEQP
jgi:uncharacterized membrane-anchored protein